MSNPQGSIALLGTGLLGEAIAQRLLQKGVALRVWNRNPDRCRRLLELGATAVPSLPDAALGCDAVITVLRDGAATATSVAALAELHGSRHPDGDDGGAKAALRNK